MSLASQTGGMNFYKLALIEVALLLILAVFLAGRGMTPAPKDLTLDGLNFSESLLLKQQITHD